MERAFERHADDIAAIIIEPIQGEGGDNHFRPEFFKELRKTADEKGAMLVFDEVQAGVGLTGKFWAFEHYGVTPDMAPDPYFTSTIRLDCTVPSSVASR